MDPKYKLSFDSQLIKSLTILKMPPKKQEPIPLKGPLPLFKISRPNAGRAVKYANFGPTKETKAIQPPNLSYMRANKAGPSMTQANRNKLADFRFKHPDMAHMNLNQFKILKQAGLLTPTPSPPRRVQPNKVVQLNKVVPMMRVTRLQQMVNKTPGVAGITRKPSPKKRIRINGKLPSGYKKANLITVLKKKGIPVDPAMSVSEITDMLNRYVTLSPISKVRLQVPLPKSQKTREEWLLKMASKFVPLEKRTKKQLQNYANRHQIKNVKMSQLKQKMIDKIEKKLDTNVKSILRNYVMKNGDPNKLTMRMVINSLISNHGWDKAKNLNRSKIQEIVEKNWKVLINS